MHIRVVGHVRTPGVFLEHFGLDILFYYFNEFTLLVSLLCSLNKSLNSIVYVVANCIISCFCCLVVFCLLVCFALLNL